MVKICTECKKEFEGSAKARLCPECKKKHHEAAVALQNARRNEQSLVKCEWCGRVFARKKNEKKCEACRKKEDMAARRWRHTAKESRLK